MNIQRNIYILISATLLSLLAGCADNDIIPGTSSSDGTDIIHVGGLECAAIRTTLGDISQRATGSAEPKAISPRASRAAGDNTPVDAETVDWLLGPLFGGLDITYGAKDQPGTEEVAILKLQKKDPAGGNTKDNIKYSQYSDPDDPSAEKIAEYSFKYLNEPHDDAKWYDNGEHYFQGVFVPEKLRFKLANSETVETVNSESGKAPNLKFDQSKDDAIDADANYTLLERYLGMPADASIHATVGRIKLPFRHRLARVLAYVLIDPTMGNAVTIDGYKKNADGTDAATEDATTSAIRFCNVDVLAGVEEKAGSTSGHAELTPQWETARKVIPHFVEESGSKNSLGVVTASDFIMFYDTELKVYIFPTNDDDWLEAKTVWDAAYAEALGAGTTDEEKRRAADEANAVSGYERTVYGQVPCYDLIVRPTYKNEDMVMYDEDLTSTSKAALATLKNNIDFEITLNNGLEYYKEFKFDLDANFQTIVYLRINRESIDYNNSGAGEWKELSDDDGFYGVNNQNGNTLSFAGSSWQRAYRFSSTNPAITDGHYYGQDDSVDDDEVQDDDAMPFYPQYVSEAQWIEMFAEAREGGLHHGDYFILDHNLTIDVSQLPDDFVFTGHLDGQDHTLTLTDSGSTGRTFLFSGLNGAYVAAIGVANVHSEGGILVPYVDPESHTGWRAEVINTKLAGADMFPTEGDDTVLNLDGTYNVAKVSGYIYNCWKGSERVQPHTPTLPKYN